MSDLDDNVIFNGDLQCTHGWLILFANKSLLLHLLWKTVIWRVFSGNFDFKCYETKERRIVVEVWEWNNLVDDVFTPHQAYKVITDEHPCSICEENFKAIFKLV